MANGDKGRPVTVANISAMIAIMVVVGGVIAAFYTGLNEVNQKIEDEKNTIRSLMNAKDEQIRKLALAQGAEAKNVSREQFNLIAVRTNDDIKDIRRQLNSLNSRATGLETRLATVLEANIRQDTVLAEARKEQMQRVWTAIKELRIIRDQAHRHHSE